jgi:3-hydroxyacyl-CoA dehydrogenase
MSFSIQKAAVIGSGTMGAGIAALLAGVGVETLLLDLPAKDSQPGDPPEKRNAIALAGLARLQNTKPPQLLNPSDIEHIQAGNTEDDFGQLADADWIIEVVVERLNVKREVMAKIAQVAKPGAVISTNTSGIPISAIAEGLGADFSRHFLGTHFFNPPRYLKLLEVIPHPDMDRQILDNIVAFAGQTLEKGVVICRDTPNFIGNRFLTITGMQVMNTALDQGLTIDEVDLLTGPLIGRPRTGTFRLNDLIGIDVFDDIAHNLYPAIPDDPARDVIQQPKTRAILQQLLERGWLGNKSGQGFYKVVKDVEGNKFFWTLDFETMEHQPPTQPQFASVQKHAGVENTLERLRLLLNEDDRAGKFLWHIHAFYLAYASQRVPEITDSFVNIDNAQKWGFNHEFGPFEIWDALGVADTIPQFEAAGYPVATWVKKMIAEGRTSFYTYNVQGEPIGAYPIEV